MLRYFKYIVFVLFFISSFVISKPLTQEAVLKLSDALQKEWVIQDERLLVVDIQGQKLFVIFKNAVRYVYTISTSKYGIGNKSGSLKTPLGMHRITETYGDRAELGTIFKARINTGKLYDFSKPVVNQKKDFVLTRILRLRGLERGINKGKGIDSYTRCIYIHGTSDEFKIGRPSSRGCVRMRNLDLIDLYEYVQKGDYVYIRG